MNPHYNQDYSREQIDAILVKIKDCVNKHNYSIALNEKRQENLRFINEYNVRKDTQATILLQLQAEDFCHSLKNTRIGFEHEILYVFVPQVTLYDSDGLAEMMDVYIKVNIIELPSGTRTVVISFHKRNKPIEYLFRIAGNERRHYDGTA